MSERKRDITVHLAWSQLDTPIVPIPTDARVHLSVDPPESESADDQSPTEQRGSVSIVGNSAGLFALAEHLLAIAHTEIEGYQQHFTEDVPENFLDSDGNWELIVGRDDRRTTER